jgi:hypothetical protein
MDHSQALARFRAMAMMRQFEEACLKVPWHDTFTASCI